MASLAGSEGTSIIKTSFQADPDFLIWVSTFAIYPNEICALMSLSPSLAFIV
jgi:hypothetical protein